MGPINPTLDDKLAQATEAAKLAYQFHPSSYSFDVMDRCLVAKPQQAKDLTTTTTIDELAARVQKLRVPIQFVQNVIEQRNRRLSVTEVGIRRSGRKSTPPG